jgi:hypothetical protein
LVPKARLTDSRIAADISHELPERSTLATFVLDTLAYSDTLKAGGFSEQQAATQARALAEILDRQMATKAEVADHENNLRRDLHETELRLDARIRETELKLEAKLAETNARIAEVKANLTRWVIGAGVLQTTVIVGVLMKVAKLI